MAASCKQTSTAFGKMKISTTCLCFFVLLVATIAVSSTEAGRKRLRGKFVTQGGSKCKWIEKRHRRGETYSLLVSCKCTDKQGEKSFYSYQCKYTNSEVDNTTIPLNETQSDFFNNVAKIVADGQHGCDLNSIDIPTTNVTLSHSGSKTPDQCQMPTENKNMNDFFEKFEERMMNQFQRFHRKLNRLFGSSTRSLWDDFKLF